MIELPLRNSKQTTLVSDSDHPRIIDFLEGRSLQIINGYVYGRFAADRQKNGDYTVKKTLHRFLIECPSYLDIDHINGNKLDNTRENLRVITHHLNTLLIKNRKSFKLDKSLPKGVSRYHFKKLKFIARIKYKCNSIHLGIFNSIEEASSAYQKAWAKYNEETNPQGMKELELN